MTKRLPVALLLAIAVAGSAWLSLRVPDTSERAPEPTASAPAFYQTLDTQPAPVLSPQQALAAFRVAPGFEIELVAAEPLVQAPVAMDWDEHGRLYVVEMRGFMRDADGSGSDQPLGQVVRLTDNDGDGRMDASEVFLGALVNPRAVAVVNEGVLIGEPPHLWLCALPARDALCSDKRRVGDYAADAAASNVEHLENGLRRGLDNWLYNANSARSLRLADNGALIERAGIERGQWGIASDDYGRLLYNHNSTWLQVDLFAAEDLVHDTTGAPRQGLGVNLTPQAEVFSVRVNPGVNRAYLDGTLRPDGRLYHVTAVSGLAVYRGDQFPDDYRGNAFVPEAAANVVAQFALRDDGIALRAEQRLYDDPQWGKRDFLGSTDERFRPVDAMNGPDGALYIVDMYRGIVQDKYFLTSQLRAQILERQLDRPIDRGRIWRVRHSQRHGERDLPDLGTAADTALIAALGHANGWVRDTAQRLLLARGGDLAPALEAVATADNRLAALHALWTLQGRGELRREVVLQAVRSADVPRQVQALRAGHSRLTAGDLLALHEAWPSPPDMLAMQLAFAMGDHTADASVRAALADLLSANLASAYVRQAVVRALAQRELAFLHDNLASGALAVDSAPARAALRALAGSAYRSLRGDSRSDAPANPELLALLELAASRSGAFAWQQVALLKGVEGAAGAEGFVPAQLDRAPPIFADSAITEQHPLWAARNGARAAFTWPGDERALGLKPLTAAQRELVARGAALYAQCASCHGDNGAGIAGLAPALARSEWVSGPPEWLGRIILQGLTGPVTVRGETFDGAMPGHGHLAELDDSALAGLMTYLRRNWGNRADAVSAETVAGIRAASAQRARPWTVAELRAVPYDRGYRRFEGEYAISFVTLTVAEKPEGLFISAPLYGGGKLEAVNDTTFDISVGGESARIEFVADADGAVNALRLHRKGETLLAQRKP